MTIGFVQRHFFCQNLGNFLFLILGGGGGGGGGGGLICYGALN